jgi:hypothetical protein
MHLRANLHDEPCVLPAAPGRLLHSEGDMPIADALAPWSGAWTLEA